jgi:hypothetical protein
MNTQLIQLFFKFRGGIVLTGLFQWLKKFKKKTTYQRPINPGRGKLEAGRHAVDIPIVLREKPAVPITRHSQLSQVDHCKKNN